MREAIENEGRRKGNRPKTETKQSCGASTLSLCMARTLWRRRCDHRQIAINHRAGGGWLRIKASKLRSLFSADCLCVGLHFLLRIACLMPTTRDCCVALLSALATLAISHVARTHGGAHLTSSGRAKSVGDRAFVLSVTLDFQDAATATELVEAWSAAAAWCLKNEPFLYAYEVAQSDKDPLSYVIVERYRNKSDYLGPHRSSPAFKEFRPRMRALQESGKVKVGGRSYIELGVGFT